MRSGCPFGGVWRKVCSVLLMYLEPKIGDDPKIAKKCEQTTKSDKKFIRLPEHADSLNAEKEGTQKSRYG